MINRICSGIALWLLRGYKRFISPVMPPLCRFEPTCSVYMMQAIQRKGFLKGLLLGTWRICRCNPFSRGGWDPVEPDDRPTYLDVDNPQP